MPVRGQRVARGRTAPARARARARAPGRRRRTRRTRPGRPAAPAAGTAAAERGGQVRGQLGPPDAQRVARPAGALAEHRAAGRGLGESRPGPRTARVEADDERAVVDFVHCPACWLTDSPSTSPHVRTAPRGKARTMITARIRAELPRMSDSLRKVGEAVLADPAAGHPRVRRGAGAADGDVAGHRDAVLPGAGPGLVPAAAHRAGAGAGARRGRAAGRRAGAADRAGRRPGARHRGGRPGRSAGHAADRGPLDREALETAAQALVTGPQGGRLRRRGLGDRGAGGTGAALRYRLRRARLDGGARGGDLGGAADARGRGARGVALRYDQRGAGPGADGRRGAAPSRWPSRATRAHRWPGPRTWR